MIVGNSNSITISVGNKKTIPTELQTDQRAEKNSRHQVTDEIFPSVKFNGNYRRIFR